jgi:hypothetical protein
MKLHIFHFSLSLNTTQNFCSYLKVNTAKMFTEGTKEGGKIGTNQTHLHMKMNQKVRCILCRHAAIDGLHQLPAVSVTGHSALLQQLSVRFIQCHVCLQISLKDGGISFEVHCCKMGSCYLVVRSVVKTSGPVILRQCRGLLSTAVVLLHANVQAFCSRATD